MVAQEYRSSRHSSANIPSAIRWYEAAGDSGSLFEVARICQLGPGIPVDLQKAIGIYLRLLTKDEDPYARLAEMEMGNLVLDGRYTSHDPKTDLGWARSVAQELIGQEQLRLWPASGSAMDLPGTAEVDALVVRTAASYDVDLAQRQMAEWAGAAGRLPEELAWLRLGQDKQSSFRMQADQLQASLSAKQIGEAADILAELRETKARSGAYYPVGDPLRDPGMRYLEEQLAAYGDVDQQLRLAYYYKQSIGESANAGHALSLYRLIRDERVGSVRLKIGTDYLLGRDHFPKNTQTAALWYGFAAKAGSKEACARLAETAATGVNVVKLPAGCIPKPN